MIELVANELIKYRAKHELLASGLFIYLITLVLISIPSDEFLTDTMKGENYAITQNSFYTTLLYFIMQATV